MYQQILFIDDYLNLIITLQELPTKILESCQDKIKEMEKEIKTYEFKIKVYKDVIKKYKEIL